MYAVTFLLAAAEPSTFVDLVRALAWPVTVFMLVFLFRNQLTDVLKAITAAKRIEVYGVKGELEEGGEEARVSLLKAAVASSPHSYEVLRNTTPLNLSNEQFGKLADKYPHVFRKVRIVRHDDKGNESFLPGIGLKKQ